MCVLCVCGMCPAVPLHLLPFTLVFVPWDVLEGDVYAVLQTLYPFEYFVELSDLKGPECHRAEVPKQIKLD